MLQVMETFTAARSEKAGVESCAQRSSMAWPVQSVQRDPHTHALHQDMRLHSWLAHDTHMAHAWGHVHGTSTRAGTGARTCLTTLYPLTHSHTFEHCAK